MSYLTFYIIFIAIMLVILLALLVSKKTSGERNCLSPSRGDKYRKQKRKESREIAYPKRYLSDSKTMVFFDDSKSSDPEKQRVGSHFWIETSRMSDGIHLSLFKNNWGAEADYMMNDSGFVESIKTVKGDDMLRLMSLCDNAENGSEVVEYLYKRFSPDGYSAYINILKWLEENGINMSSFMSW